ncbi:sigma-54-dependent Fis family transcriptional regulator [bacterium]|nr:MAG: sigma-54-dependent Fis family transcriptional regulator [bacterium]
MSESKDSTASSILVVDDEQIVRESLGAWLREDGHKTRLCADGRQALAAARDEEFELALVDLKMPGMDGLEVARRLRDFSPRTTVVVMTAFASVDTAVLALKEGAYDYITKPFDPEVLSHLLRRAREERELRRQNTGLRKKLAAATQPPRIQGSSPALQRVVELIENVAPGQTSVLITGESGVGKELVARAIHAGSPRALMPLVIVNCGALPEGTLESELFGHERGAFTGAQYRHKGKFELADGGTLFLDEIGEVSHRMQVEMLRVLEEKRVVRMGGHTSVQADFRVVAATNRDLKRAVKEGHFREDLYYRLNVFHIDVPPLRDRVGDIEELALHFAARLARQMNRAVPSIQEDAMQRLMEYDWPGNVRELANAIERAMVVSRDNLIRLEDLPIDGVIRRQHAPGGRSLAAVERDHIHTVLDETDWNISEAARILEVDRGTVYNKIRAFGLERERTGGTAGSGRSR